MSSLFSDDFVTLAFWSPGPAEMLVLAVVALLLYGGNLPEFRRGLTGFQSELNEVIYSQPEQIAYQDQSYRDDSRNADGYEETDDYQDESESPKDERDTEGKSDSEVDDQSEQTIRDAGAETIVIENNENNENNNENNEEKPAEEKFTDWRSRLFALWC